MSLYTTKENVTDVVWYPPIKEVDFIRKVNLNMDEQKKYDVIKRLVDENGNKDRAALTLGITKRQVYRLIKLCSW